MRWLIGVLLGLSSALVACGGDDNKRADTINATAAVTSPGTPAAAASSPTAASTRQVLVVDTPKALLALDDLPTGWSSTTSNPPNGDTMVCDKRLQRYSDKALDYQRVEFDRGGGLNVSNIVGRYAQGEAQRLIDDLRQLYEGCSQWSSTDNNGRPISFRAAALSFPKLGDQTFAVRLTGSGSGVTAQSDQVVVRRGDVLTIVSNSAVGLGSVSVDSDLTEKLARRADERLANAPQVPAGSVSTSTPVARAATPTPQPTQQVKILLQGFGQASGVSSRQVGYGFMVENPNPGDAAERTSYQVAFYDQAGTVLKTEQNYIEQLYPGEKRGIGGTAYLGEGQTVARMDVQLKTERFKKSESQPPFTAEGVTFRPDRFSPKVVGVVRSSLPRDTKSVHVSVLAYGADGQIIGGGFTFLDFVPANGQAAVEVFVTSSVQPVKVELYPSLSVLSGLN